MSAPVFPHTGTYTIDEFFTLEDPPGYRLELAGGALVVSPLPAPRHQHALAELRDAIKPAATGHGWRVYLPINLKLGVGTVRAPDLTILRSAPRGRDAWVEASQAVAVVELVSPGSEYADLHEKPSEYASADIKWFVRLHDTPAGWRGEVYVLSADSSAYDLLEEAEPAQLLKLPFLGVEVDLRTLG